MAIIRLLNSSYDCSDNSTLLDGALESGVLLNYSCKEGRCSSCKVKVISGETKPIQPEATLTEEDRLKGFILSCCRKPLTDVKLDVEDLSAYSVPQSKTIPTKVSSFEYLTEDIIRVNLRYPPNQKVEFLAGQYLNVLHKGIKRSYSIASSISENELQLIIRNYPGGVMSKYWFEEIEPNDLLRVELPLGTFFLRSLEEIETLIFVGTGTGIAPIKSILESSGLLPDQKIYVLWGMRHQYEIFWKPNNDEIDFYSCLSRDGSKWNYVQDPLTQMDVDFSKAAIYACGNIDMINSVKALSIQKGLKSNNFYSDAFVQS